MKTQRRRSSTIPFGWELSDDKPGLLVAVKDEQEALEEALGYIAMGCSIRETAQWLSATTSRKITDKGLKKIQDREKRS